MTKLSRAQDERDSRQELLEVIGAGKVPFRKDVEKFEKHPIRGVFNQRGFHSRTACTSIDAVKELSLFDSLAGCPQGCFHGFSKGFLLQPIM